MHADESLFQQVTFRVERLLRNVRKKLSAAFASAERVAGHDALQLVAHRLAVGMLERGATRGRAGRVLYPILALNSELKWHA